MEGGELESLGLLSHSEGDFDNELGDAFKPACRSREVSVGLVPLPFAT
jgi:hypothetical protein